VRRSHVKLEHFDESRQSRRLTLGQVEHQPCESRGVDDWMLERPLEAASHQPGVECVVAVLDEDGSV
jgi:hypothetical protein